MAHATIETAMPGDRDYIEQGVMELQDYANVASSAIYAELRRREELGETVFDQQAALKEEKDARGVRSLPLGMFAFNHTRVLPGGGNRP